MPKGAQALTDQGNEAHAVISLVEGDTIAVEDPTGGAHELGVSGVGRPTQGRDGARGHVGRQHLCCEMPAALSGGIGPR